jgi:hypothetical protein
MDNGVVTLLAELAAFGADNDRLVEWWRFVGGINPEVYKLSAV